MNHHQKYLTPVQSLKPLFKLTKSTSGEPLLVVQASDHAQAMERFQLIWLLHRQGPANEPANSALFTVERHSPSEPIVTPAFLEGWFTAFEGLPRL